jgi:hypothetical protein
MERGMSSPRARLFKKGGRRDLNPQHPEPQSGALPLSYDHHAEAEKEGSASSGPAKQIFSGHRRVGGSAFPSAAQAMENNCNHVPINYGPALILKKESNLQSRRFWPARWK